MGLLDSLLRRHKADEEITAEPQACSHMVLTARWDSVADMGDEDKATGFTCTACGDAFTREQGRQLRSDSSDRIQNEDSGDKPTP